MKNKVFGKKIKQLRKNQMKILNKLKIQLAIIQLIYMKSLNELLKKELKTGN